MADEEARAQIIKLAAENRRLREIAVDLMLEISRAKEKAASVARAAQV